MLQFLLGFLVGCGTLALVGKILRDVPTYCSRCEASPAEYCMSCLNEVAADNMSRDARGRFRPRAQV